MKVFEHGSIAAGVTVSTATFLGFGLQEWVYILTIVTLLINLGVKAAKPIKCITSKFKKVKDND